MDFIEIYDNACSKEECDILIDHFNNSPNKTSGEIIYNNKSIVDSKIKISTDLYEDLNQDKAYNNIILNAIKENIPKYKKKYTGIEKTNLWNLETGYNIQKFEDGGGYFLEHSEQSSIHPKRMLVWMIYLNDAECGTRFLHQERIVEAKMGRLVLWPSFWTHTHCGVTPNKGNKYIATGWFRLLNI